MRKSLFPSEKNIYFPFLFPFHFFITKRRPFTRDRAPKHFFFFLLIIFSSFLHSPHLFSLFSFINPLFSFSTPTPLYPPSPPHNPPSPLATENARTFACAPVGLVPPSVPRPPRRRRRRRRSPPSAALALATGERAGECVRACTQATFHVPGEGREGGQGEGGGRGAQVLGDEDNQQRPEGPRSLLPASLKQEYHN